MGAYLIGKRVGFGKEAFKPHNLPMVFTGTAILYFGWFGFNADSASAANEIAALAFVNTVVATAGAILSRVFGEWAVRGKPSLLGACSGAIAGLVGITPACGYVGVGGALLVGPVSGLAGLWGVTALKRLLRVDDPCDVFGVHGVCGIVGCIMTGIFAAKSLGGVGYAEGVDMVHRAGTAGKYRHYRCVVCCGGLHWLQTGGHDCGSARTGRAGARRSRRQQPRRECV